MLKKLLVVSMVIVIAAMIFVPLVAEAGGPQGRGNGQTHGDGICDQSSVNFIDEDGDGLCDNEPNSYANAHANANLNSTDASQNLNFVDADGDGVCDSLSANLQRQFAKFRW